MKYGLPKATRNFRGKPKFPGALSNFQVILVIPEISEVIGYSRSNLKLSRHFRLGKKEIKISFRPFLHIFYKDCVFALLENKKRGEWNLAFNGFSTLEYKNLDASGLGEG